MTELEKEFEKLAIETEERINVQLEIAKAAIREAVKISEETGIPFVTSVSFIRNSYVPESFEKYEDVDGDFVYDCTEVGHSFKGWQHSAACW